MADDWGKDEWVKDEWAKDEWAKDDRGNVQYSSSDTQNVSIHTFILI